MPRTPQRSGAPGEFELIAAIRQAAARAGRGPRVSVGIGDDAAVVRAASSSRSRRSPLVLTTDTMVEGVHFRRSWLTASELGVRAYRAAVSDISAMGARPLWALLSLELPSGRGSNEETLRMVRSLAAEARRSGAALVGGNVSRAPALALTVTIIGEAAGRPVLRSGARPAHVVFVTGALGGAARGCRELAARRTAGSKAALTAAYRRPPLRVAFAAEAAGLGLLSAMIDVSDGLLQDLGHIADESRVAIRVDADAVPIHRSARLHRNGGPSALDLALAGGEDYELAFTAPRGRQAAIEKLAARHCVPIARVGVVERGRPAVTDLDGNRFDIALAGFDHLRPRARSPQSRSRTRSQSHQR